MTNPREFEAYASLEKEYTPKVTCWNDQNGSYRPLIQQNAGTGINGFITPSLAQNSSQVDSLAKWSLANSPMTSYGSPVESMTREVKMQLSGVGAQNASVGSIVKQLNPGTNEPIYTFVGVNSPSISDLVYTYVYDASTGNIKRLNQKEQVNQVAPYDFQTTTQQIKPNEVVVMIRNPRDTDFLEQVLRTQCQAGGALQNLAYNIHSAIQAQGSNKTFMGQTLSPIENGVIILSPESREVSRYIQQAEAPRREKPRTAIDAVFEVASKSPFPFQALVSESAASVLGAVRGGYSPLKTGAISNRNQLRDLIHFAQDNPGTNANTFGQLIIEAGQLNDLAGLAQVLNILNNTPNSELIERSLYQVKTKASSLALGMNTTLLEPQTTIDSLVELCPTVLDLNILTKFIIRHKQGLLANSNSPIVALAGYADDISYEKNKTGGNPQAWLETLKKDKTIPDEFKSLLECFARPDFPSYLWL